MKTNSDSKIATKCIDTILSETAAKLALQSAEDNLNTKTGKHLKRFSQQLNKKLAQKELKKTFSPLDPLDPSDPLNLLKQMPINDNKNIIVKIEDKEKGDETHETEIHFQTTADENQTNISENSEMAQMSIRSPKSEPERDYRLINLFDWNKLVVEMRALDLYYGRNTKVLDKVNMSVPKSAIYSLLGPTGCGKSTLLKVILGLIKPNSGTIKVNGKSPGDPKNTVPGFGVGFMPQELAVYTELTLNEALKYFGRIYNMTAEQIVSRITFLIDFLDLPDPERQIQYMSRGQKKRVSLSLSLIHNPPLLILDEPTTGSDPVLRERIWDHLRFLSQNESTTIILTTHYAEEARRAHVMSIMKNGKLLIEHSPQYLLKQFEVQNFEEMFLRVYRLESIDQKLLPKSYYQTINTDNAENDEKSSQKLIDCKISEKNNNNKQEETDMDTTGFQKNVLTQTHNNLIRLIRNKPLLFFEAILPTIIVVLFSLCIGSKPFNLKIAVFNEEFLGKTEDLTKFSVIFLASIDNKTIILKTYNSKESAIKSIDSSHDIYGVLVFKFNFSNCVEERIASKLNTNDKYIDNSTIRFYGDFTDMIISDTITRTLINAEIRFDQKLVQDVFQLSHKSKVDSLFDPIIKIDEPVYGSTDPQYRYYLGPGLLLAVIYLTAIRLALKTIVFGRNQCLFERTLVCGLKEHEILTAQIIIHFLIIFIQTLFVVVFSVLIFHISNRGNVLLVLLLVVLQGLTAMSFGLLISSVIIETSIATMIGFGYFFLHILLSGILWPLEGMPFSLRIFAYLLPQTLSIISFRNIMLKGWSITQMNVYLGFISTIIWLFVFLLFAFNFIKLRKQ